MNDWMLYLLAGFLTGLGFFIQRLTGFGSALIAIPFMAAVWDPVKAINLQLIYQIIFGVVLLPATWRSLLGQRMRSFTVAAIPLLALGAWILPEMPSLVIKFSLGIILVLVIIQWTFAPRFTIPAVVQQPAAVVSGFLTGTVHGMYGTGGPFLLAYYANVEKNPAKIRNATIAFFGIANLVRLPVAAGTAQITQDVLIAAAVAAPFFVAGMVLGERLKHRVDLRVFRLMTIAILGLAIISLLF